MVMKIKDIRLLELELFSYCNRKCDWCPNKYIDRITDNKILSDRILINLLKELKEKEFNGTISFSRYNEPLSSFSTSMEKVLLIKKFLPKVKLVSNTNGDFINNSKECLEFLKLIDELSIMDYNCLGYSYWKNKLIDLDFQYINYDEKNDYLNMTYLNNKILVCCNWSKHAIIENRASALTDTDIMNYKNNLGKIRKNPCYEPKYFVGINYDGTVSPCCNFRNDIKEHQNFILGDLHYNNLEEILNFSKAINFRKNCEKGIFNNPCITCFKPPGRYTRNNPGINY